MLISSEDAVLFHKLNPLLLAYAVQRVAPAGKRQELESRIGIFAEAAVEARDLLFSNPDLIGHFVSENPENLSNSELEIISSWKNFRRGSFIIERVLKNFAVFLEFKENGTGYGVVGLLSEIDEMLGFQPLPVQVETVLLPWKGRIIHDGFFVRYSICFGPNLRRSFKNMYINAKTTGLVTALEGDSDTSLQGDRPQKKLGRSGRAMRATSA
jgi:hypothetical protein